MGTKANEINKNGNWREGYDAWNFNAHTLYVNGYGDRKKNAPIHITKLEIVPVNCVHAVYVQHTIVVDCFRPNIH